MYIQVPITGRDIEDARNEAKYLKQSVEMFGYEAVTPFDFGIPENATTPEAMGKCIEELLKCDAILIHDYACDVWTGLDEKVHSKGCRAEALVALSYGMKTYVLPDYGEPEEVITDNPETSYLINRLIPKYDKI